MRLSIVTRYWFIPRLIEACHQAALALCLGVVFGTFMQVFSQVVSPRVNLVSCLGEELTWLPAPWVQGVLVPACQTAALLLLAWVILEYAKPSHAFKREEALAE